MYGFTFDWTFYNGFVLQMLPSRFKSKLTGPTWLEYQALISQSKKGRKSIILKTGCIMSRWNSDDFKIPGGDFFRAMTFSYSRSIIYDYNKSSLTLKKYQLNQRLISKCFKMKVDLHQQIQVQLKSYKIL